MMKTFLTLSAIALLFSCQDVTVSTDELVEKAEDLTEEISENNSEETTQDEESPEVDYNEDWTRFKSAVIAKDLQGIGAFASSDDVDAEELLKYMETPAFLEALKKSSFDDLELEVTEAGSSYVFQALDSETNEDGFEMESAIHMYFTKGENGLEYDRVVVAG